jgi:membrane protein DedA with SNARE-associated domain
MHSPLINSITSAISSNNPWFAVIAIIAATFVHEDLATVATGMMVADGLTGMGVAIPALYVGIVVGDIGLYGLGRLIALNPFSKRFESGERFTAAKVWLDRRLFAGVFIVRFLPGLRLSAYTSYGFFAMPFRRFVLSVILAAGIWTTGLFYLSYEFGALSAKWLGFWRWPAIFIAIIVPLFVVQRIVHGGLQAAVAARKIDSRQDLTE